MKIEGNNEKVKEIIPPGCDTFGYKKYFKPFIFTAKHIALYISQGSSEKEKR